MIKEAQEIINTYKEKCGVKELLYQYMIKEWIAFIIVLSLGIIAILLIILTNFKILVMIIYYLIFTFGFIVFLNKAKSILESKYSYKRQMIPDFYKVLYDKRVRIMYDNMVIKLKMSPEMIGFLKDHINKEAERKDVLSTLQTGFVVAMIAAFWQIVSDKLVDLLELDKIIIWFGLVTSIYAFSLGLKMSIFESIKYLLNYKNFFTKIL